MVYALLTALVLLSSTSLVSSATATVFDNGQGKVALKVPNIVHQTYDYQGPSYFLFLSIMCVQRFVKPERHILWVNIEGRHRGNAWTHWQNSVAEGSWEQRLANLIKEKKIEVRTLNFPANPPGNTSVIAHNKAHRSDFVRMDALYSMGGVYLDTDAFVTSSLDSLRLHDFVISFDNIVDPDKSKPKRMNNGVLLSAPNSSYLKHWMNEYALFNPDSFDYDSSVVPYRLAMQYPDLVHLEMNRISPISFFFQTSVLAESLACGILDRNRGGIWHPSWSISGRTYTYEGIADEPDRFMLAQADSKLVLHLTMSQVRGICMLRKNLRNAEDLKKLPSYLGSLFRTAVHGEDSFDYAAAASATKAQKQASWKECRNFLGMHTTPDPDDKTRLHYTGQPPYIP